jgi:hypothetical protein
MTRRSGTPRSGRRCAVASRSYARALEVCPALRVNAHDAAVPHAERVAIAALDRRQRVVRPHIRGPYD